MQTGDAYTATPELRARILRSTWLASSSHRPCPPASAGPLSLWRSSPGGTEPVLCPDRVLPRDSATTPASGPSPGDVSTQARPSRRPRSESSRRKWGCDSTRPPCSAASTTTNADRIRHLSCGRLGRRSRRLAYRPGGGGCCPSLPARAFWTVRVCRAWTRIPESEREVIEVPLGSGDSVFAPTGAILYQLREAAMHGRPTVCASTSPSSPGGDDRAVR